MSNTNNLTKAQIKTLFDHQSAEIAKLTKNVLNHNHDISIIKEKIQSNYELLNAKIGINDRSLYRKIEEIVKGYDFSGLLSKQYDNQEEVTNRNNQLQEDNIDERPTNESATDHKRNYIETLLVNIFGTSDFNELKNDLEAYIKRTIKYGIYAALIGACIFFLYALIYDNFLINTKKLNRYEIQLQVIEELHPDVYENSNEIMGDEETLEEITKRINWKERGKELEEQIKALEKEKPEGID